MAQIRVMRQPTKPVRERREEALERLLYVACSRLLPDDLNRLGDKALVDLATDVVSEAAFWLDLQPRGAKVHATSPELRLGREDFEVHRSQFADKLDEHGALVRVQHGQNGKAK